MWGPITWITPAGHPGQRTQQMVRLQIPTIASPTPSTRGTVGNAAETGYDLGEKTDQISPVL